MRAMKGVGNNVLSYDSERLYFFLSAASLKRSSHGNRSSPKEQNGTTKTRIFTEKRFSW
jgi:hypothetical protein